MKRILPLLLLPASVLAAPASSSDYYQDQARVWVAEHSSAAFNLVNQVLCYFGQTRYSDFVNKGPYRAQVDGARCESRDSPSKNSQSGSESSGDAPDYMDWIVNVTRASDSAPQVVNVWVTEADSDFSMKILARITITEAASSSNKYGLFTLDFAGFPLVNGVQGSNALMKGLIAVSRGSDGQLKLEFIDQDSHQENGLQVSQQRAGTLQHSSTDSGAAVVQDVFNGQNRQFRVAFDSDFFLRQSGADPQRCFVRNQFEETAWQYALYDSNGARIKLNGGFPIKASSNGRDYFGFAGYHGLWLPPEVTLNDGDSVTRMQRDGSGSSYTLLKVNGKLTRHTRRALTLADIAGLPLEWSTPGSNTRYLISWDKDLAKFRKLRQATFTSGSPMSWTAIEPPQDLSSSELNNAFELNVWSQALGGNLRVPLRDNQNQALVLGNASAASVMVQTVILPGDSVPASLNCLGNCPDPAKLTSSAPYDNPMGTQNPQPIAYSFDNMRLLRSGSPVTLASGQQLDSAFQWGLHSGPLVESSQLPQLLCPWNSSQYCSWQAWQKLDSFYAWQTGNQPWQQLTLLKDGSGNVLKFDRPLALRVSAPKQAPASIAGASFFLEYNGEGQLHGIPGDCVDPATNAPTACGPGKRWLPLFSLKDSYDAAGNQNGDLLQGDNQSSYLVKALHKEQRMKLAADQNSCSTLSLQSLSLPDISRATGPLNMPAEPSVSAAPAVIAGIIQ